MGLVVMVVPEDGGRCSELCVRRRLGRGAVTGVADACRRAALPRVVDEDEEGVVVVVVVVVVLPLAPDRPDDDGVVGAASCWEEDEEKEEGGGVGGRVRLAEAPDRPGEVPGLEAAPL